MIAFRAQQVARLQVRAEILKEHEKANEVKRQLDQYTIRLDPYCQQIHEQTGRWPGSLS